jgi:hypothetical protein
LIQIPGKARSFTRSVRWCCFRMLHNKFEYIWIALEHL